MDIYIQIGKRITPQYIFPPGWDFMATHIRETEIQPGVFEIYDGWQGFFGDVISTPLAPSLLPLFHSYHSCLGIFLIIPPWSGLSSLVPFQELRVRIPTTLDSHALLFYGFLISTFAIYRHGPTNVL